jgi:predicted acylesterase/phospholipase RssA
MNKKVINSTALFTLASSLFLGVFADPDPNAYCTALVLSGGGSNGAWEAGIIWGLLHYGDPADYRYDVVSGVSAGSINSALLAGWEVGDEYNASEFVSEKWDTIRTADVWQ